ncbi:hypothetical protein CsatB_007277 [Cannabis sativa]|uniref:uncharacterized protein LOC115721788 n=1 Tax=Cannabis sativa TaxID=3483 RepID=UPI0029CAA446|nr:uncharacterized protein LOC115721788 [Cannabis sativa]
MLDNVTKKRERLNYARVLIEVLMDQSLPDMVDFENEFGMNTTIGIKYEWKPVSCSHCSGVGHFAAECKKNSNGTQQWIIKKDNRKQGQVDDEGLTKVTNSRKGVVRGTINGSDGASGKIVQNSFQALGEEDVNLEAVEEYPIMVNTGGGSPLFLMDKLLCWNVRGANNQHKQQLIKQFINSQKVDFVGLLETRVKAPKLGGKIVIAWNPWRFTVDILKCTSQLMHLKLSTVEGYDSFLTVVYASNSRVERRILWKDLMDLNTAKKWLLMGDFNDILAKEERVGHRVKFYPHVEFVNCVNSYLLQDVKASGNFFTWSNKQHGEDRIFSKIDRILANQTWINKYELAEAVYLNEGLFDHTPAILSLHPDLVSGKKPFKYFKMWKSHPKYDSCLKEVWDRPVVGTKMFQVISKMKQFKLKLKEINKEGFHDLHAAVSKKAKSSWIQSGDCNTTLFHACIKQRQRQNRIFSIEKHDGSRVNDPTKITKAFLEFYNKLLGTKMDNRRKIETNILARGPILTPDHVNLLT